MDCLVASLTGPEKFLLPYTGPYRVNDQPYFTPVHTRLMGEEIGLHLLRQGEILADRTLHGGVYAGFGGWVNLGYIAASKPKLAVLADVNPLQALHWGMLLNLMKACPKFDDYKRRLPRVIHQIERTIESRAAIWPRSNPRYDTDRPCYGYPKHVFDQASKIELLAYGLAELNYEPVQKLAASDGIKLAVLDAKDDAAFHQFDQALQGERRQRQAGPATVTYVSNIPVYFHYAIQADDCLSDHTGMAIAPETQADFSRRMAALTFGSGQAQRPGMVVSVDADGFVHGSRSRRQTLIDFRTG